MTLSKQDFFYFCLKLSLVQYNKLSKNLINLKPYI